MVRLTLMSASFRGSGDVSPGEGVSGLRAALTVAGARSVVASLWEVPAGESASQTNAFIEGWLGKQGARPRYAAFRRAQLAALEASRHRPTNVWPGPNGHPFYWAGFVYAGDPGELPAAAPGTEPVR